MSRISHFFNRLFSRSSHHATAAEAGGEGAGLPGGSRTGSRRSIDAPQGTWLVIGLGNPGPEYAATRHNIGYMAIDELLERHGATLQPVRNHPASAATITLGEAQVTVARSTTYMNDSGDAVRALADSAGITPEHIDHIIVIHDELDLSAGTVRVKKGGGENGHNGLKSTTERLGTRDYLRIRMGIGRPPQGTGVVDYVLAPFDEDDSAWITSCIATAADAVGILVEQGLGAAQNQIHSR